MTVRDNDICRLHANTYALKLSMVTSTNKVLLTIQQVMKLISLILYSEDVLANVEASMQQCLNLTK